MLEIKFNIVILYYSQLYNNLEYNIINVLNN